MRRLILLIFLFAGADVSALAGEGETPEFDQTSGQTLVGPVFALSFKGDYAGAYGAALEAEQKAAEMSAETQVFVRSVLAQNYALLGDQRRAVGNSAERTAATLKHREMLAGTSTRPAVKEIHRLAAEHQIIIVNEAHNQSLQRDFARQLLLGLSALGYKYLAAETFNIDKMAELADRVSVTAGDGIYTNDPVFSEFVETALELGFKPIAYEQTQEQREESGIVSKSSSAERIASREHWQAQNLVDQLLAEEPAAKMLIYVGYSHIREEPAIRENGVLTSWMAHRLKNLTGIDPLTIDLVGGSSLGNKVDPVAIAVLEELAPDEPVLIKSAQGDWLTSEGYSGNVDATVFFPDYGYFQGRPDWLTVDGYRKWVDITDNVKELPDEIVMVQAFRLDDPEDAVPEDQYPLRPGDELSPLALSSGEFIVSFQFPGGRIEKLAKISVDHVSPW